MSIFHPDKKICVKITPTYYDKIMFAPKFYNMEFDFSILYKKLFSTIMMGSLSHELVNIYLPDSSDKCLQYLGLRHYHM